MRRWLRSRLILAIPLSMLAACSSDREVASPVDTVLEVSGVETFCPSGARQDINAIFPTRGNLRNVATGACGQIFSDFGKGKQALAAQRAFAFLKKTLEQNAAGLLLDPEPSVEARIIELFEAIFSGVGLDFPDVDPQALAEGNYAIGELTQNGPSLPTVSKKAIADDGNGLLGPVQVFIAQINTDEITLATSSVSHPCPEGVDDSYDCYPLFFDYTVFPVSNVNPAVGLQIGQCNVSPPDVEVLLLTPEGFLPPDAAPPGLDCSDVVPQVATTGWRRFAQAALAPVAPLLRVTPSFAGQNPVGGRISSFSPVAPADPNSGPPHIVVFNDINVFDDVAMGSANNVLLVQNLVTFTSGFTRDEGDEVWFDCRTSLSGGFEAGCDEESTLHTIIEGQGLSTTVITEGSLEDLPADVKVLVLWLPTTAYTAGEVNALKQFAAEGGRIVLVGEHVGIYAAEIPNALLGALGSTLEVVGGFIDCTGEHVVLPGSAIRPQQITDGLTGLTIGCSSEVTLGEDDLPLYVDTSGIHVLSGVGMIDTSPIEVAGARGVAPSSAGILAYDPLGNRVDD